MSQAQSYQEVREQQWRHIAQCTMWVCKRTIVEHGAEELVCGYSLAGGAANTTVMDTSVAQGQLLTTVVKCKPIVVLTKAN